MALTRRRKRVLFRGSLYGLLVVATVLAVFLADWEAIGRNFFNPEMMSELDREKYFSRLRKGGLGVHLIKKIMDVVEYTVSPGVKNCLTMVKYMNPARAR